MEKTKISNTDVFKRLAEWNPWWKENKIREEMKGVKREYLEDIIKWIDEKEIKVLIGPRRAGKSTLFYQIIDYIHNKNKVPFENIVLINFQDNLFLEKNLEDIYLSYIQNINPTNKLYLFIDEAQEKKGWDKWIKKMYDLKKNISFFVSGSNAKLLKSEFSSYLSGRKIEFEVYPLSLKECLKIAGISKILSLEDEAKAKNIYKNYIKYGGFPEVYFKNEQLKIDLLTNYMNDFIERDIARRYNIDSEKIRFLIKWISTNSGKEISINSLEKTLGISGETINNYLGYIKDAYLIIEVKSFSPSLKKQEIEPKRYYLIDPGLISIYEFSFREEYGKLLESVVGINLSFKNKQIYYKNTPKGEIDFIFEKNKFYNGLCVTHNPEIEREKRNYDFGIKELKLKEVKYITFDYEDEKSIPIYKWAINTF
ncbi:MAG: ATP-binding protein [Candidatus Micrarchaeia archaeon]|jgi:hypothetical protein